MSIDETGLRTAIAWLRKIGRPILADKMERELLHGKNRVIQIDLTALL